MAKKQAKTSKEEVFPILVQDNLLVFKVSRPVTDKEFELIEKRLRDQEEKTGINIVLAPYLVDLQTE